MRPIPSFQWIVKRTVVAALCCLAVAGNVRPAVADAASDQAMANRFEQAAQGGDDEAQFNLGSLYSAGVGRPRSDETAFRWFQRATDQGHSHAMLIVAGLYASGRGVTKDYAKAYGWAYIITSSSKQEEDRNGARQLMTLLMRKMTSDEIGRAVVAARAWRAVRTAAPGKSPSIEKADTLAEQPAAPPPVRDLAPAAQPAAAAAQPAPSTVAAAPAAAKPAPVAPVTTPAAPVKSARRDDVRDMLDQVPSGLRKRFGF